MSYLFFTGATGLLGDYLLKDLLSRGAKVALVARDSRLESARGRIESLLARWERILGYALPRPVVLTGDISQPMLGLSDHAVAWVTANCHSVLHNAASLSFEATPDGEPYRSNVTGTQHVLELSRRAELRQFFHVSTAYVCGLREGVIREDELELGQEPANPYEASKIQAEKMVRSAPFLKAPTVFRPGIIVGDSISGYTTTFHGFYAPLKSVHALAQSAQAGVPSDDMLRVLGFSGGERKHFVPVDWISAVMTHVILHPEHHHQTYHLTPDEPISVEQVAQSMAQALAKYSKRRPVAAALAMQAQESTKKQFEELLSAYRSYWRDDPAFDKSNTNQVAAHLPCPELNPALLDRLCRFAIQTNFGWPRPAPIKPAFDVAAHLEASSFSAECLTDERSVVGLQVNGPGGGAWTIFVDEGLLRFVPGIDDDVEVHLYLNSSTMQQLTLDPSGIDLAVKTGRLLIEGRKTAFDHAVALMRSLVGSFDHREVVI